jgi:hypothetical protein
VFKCNFPPYGKDFGGGNQPTGRFSNGLVPSDIIGTKILLVHYIIYTMVLYRGYDDAAANLYIAEK